LTKQAPATASVITYVMPVVALFLGVGRLRENLTIEAIPGLILIAAGAWLAKGRQPPGRANARVLRDQKSPYSRQDTLRGARS